VADGRYLQGIADESNVEDRQTTVKIARILVAPAGSPEAEIALPKAVELAKQNIGATVVLVRAVEPVTLGEKADSDRRAAAIHDAAEYLGNVAARLRSEGVRRAGSDGTAHYAGGRCRYTGGTARGDVTETTLVHASARARAA
jgi:nucleotide-binding universal stress UspA family protein